MIRGRLLVVLGMAFFLGGSLALATFPSEGRFQQSSARAIVAKILDDWDRKERELAQLRAAAGGVLLYSSLSGNVESFIPGVALPKSSGGGFDIVADRVQAQEPVWRSPSFVPANQAAYRIHYAVEVTAGLTLDLVLRSNDGERLVSAALPPGEKEGNIVFTGKGGRAYLELVLSDGASPEAPRQIATVNFINVMGRQK